MEWNGMEQNECSESVMLLVVPAKAIGKRHHAVENESGKTYS